MKICSCCGQTLPEELPLGLRLGPSRFDRLYADDPDGGPGSGMRVLYVRINQLNKQLRPKGKKIAIVEHHGPAGNSHYVLTDIAP